MLLYYGLKVAKQKDVTGVRRILPVLALCDTDTVYQDMALHVLISYLNNMAEHFSNAEFCDAVFDKFFLVGTCVFIYYADRVSAKLAKDVFDSMNLALSLDILKSVV